MEAVSGVYLCGNTECFVFYNINGYYDLMKQLLEHTVKEKFMEPEILDMCKFLEKQEEIFDYIEQYSAKK